VSHNTREISAGIQYGIPGSIAKTIEIAITITKDLLCFVEKGFSSFSSVEVRDGMPTFKRSFDECPTDEACAPDNKDVHHDLFWRCPDPTRMQRSGQS
jgi:hypothetical protein